MLSFAFQLMLSTASIVQHELTQLQDREKGHHAQLPASTPSKMAWISYEGPRLASSWIDPLSPRPLWLVCPAGEAIQR